MQKNLASTLDHPNLISPSKMKIKASTFLKQVFSVITTIVKAKSMAVKNKTSSIKTRLLIFGLLRNKKHLMSAISNKIHALMGQEKEGEGEQSGEDNSKAIVLYNADHKDDAMSNQNYTESAEAEEEDDYPDLRHSLFDLEDEDEDDDDELGNGTGSAIDFVKNSRVDGADFSLEDEIDLVADVFIRRFHRQMMMQKLDSFKRYREMLERSV